jgi:hypothetical protein
MQRSTQVSFPFPVEDNFQGNLVFGIFAAVISRYKEYHAG